MVENILPPYALPDSMEVLIMRREFCLVSGLTLSLK